MFARVLIVACLALSLQACGRKDAGIYADPLSRAVAAAPAADAPPLYVGRWAATASACRDQAWRFTKDHLDGPGGAACDIVGADSTPAGYSASSLCSAPGAAPKAGRLLMTLTGPGSHNSMTLSAGPFDPPLNLSRCAAQG